MKLTKIAMDPPDRMVRIGFGKHKGRWFFRADFWSVGWRLTKDEK